MSLYLRHADDLSHLCCCPHNQVASAMATLHSLGVVHTGVQAATCLTSSQGAVLAGMNRARVVGSR